MSRLRNRINTHMDNAKYDWEHRHVDDSYVDEACVQLHQAIEKSIKLLTEMNGIVYSHSHDIAYLLNDLPDSYTSAPWFAPLFLQAPTLTNWYYTLRYNDEFSTTSKSFIDIYPLAEELVKELDNTVQYVSTHETKVQHILNAKKCTHAIDKIMKLVPEAAYAYDDALEDAVLAAIKIVSRE